jgi:AbrB family looped-hinge helix DNA binding protein
MGLVDIKSVTVTSKGQITIPNAFREIHMKENDQAAILVYDDHIEVRPLTYIEEKLGCAIASQESLAKLWDTPEEDEAWEHLQKYKK